MPLSPPLSRALAWVRSCSLREGAVLEPLTDLVAFLCDPEPPLRDVLHAERGADVWYTVLALRAHRLLGVPLPDAERWLLERAAGGDGLCWWSARRGLCMETTAAAALCTPALRRRLVPVVRRHALPHGRWATFLLDRHHGHEEYVVGPSVAAWAATSLPERDPRRAPALRFLEESRLPDGAWAAHPAFYLCRWYPTHLALRLCPDRGATSAVRAAQNPDGGWAFEGEITSSTLPTAWALLSLAAFPSSGDPAVRAGRRWLLERQLPEGGWASEAIPDQVFYAGRVHATLAAVEALHNTAASDGQGSRSR